jgi:hypothetical protein
VIHGGEGRRGRHGPAPSKAISEAPWADTVEEGVSTTASNASVLQGYAQADGVDSNGHRIVCEWCQTDVAVPQSRSHDPALALNWVESRDGWRVIDGLPFSPEHRQTGLTLYRPLQFG